MPMDDRSTHRTLSPLAIAKMIQAQQEGKEKGRQDALRDSPVRMESPLLRKEFPERKVDSRE